MISQYSWEQVVPDLEIDGSFRDIYVLDVSEAEWQFVLLRLLEHYAPLEYSIGGEPATLPPRVSQIFPIWQHGPSPMLLFKVGCVAVTCYFFGSDEIEFNIDPKDVQSSEALGSVAEFLARLARWTGRPALLTPENLPTSPILRADPVSGVVAFVPAPAI